PDGPIDPAAIKIHRIRPGDLKNAPRFPTILPKVKGFVGESPIVAHAYKNERDFLDYEFARAKVIQWGESAYAEERYICTQVLFARHCHGALGLRRSRWPGSPTRMNKISYSGYRFPPEIIQQAIWLYLRFTLSLR